jgi:iron complex transport system ATP-binding protein
MKNGEIIAAGTPEEIFTETLIEELYGIRCVVYRNPITEHLAFHYYI